MIMGKAFPFGFVTLMVPTVFTELGLPLESFWVFSIATVPYWFKWLWAPIVDRRSGGRFGRRKTWILATAVFGIVAYSGLAIFDPSLDRLWLIVGLMTASQASVALGEIAIYAYCSENLDDRDRTLGTTLIVAADNIAYLIATAALVALYEWQGWTVAMLTAATLLALALLPVMIRPEPASNTAAECGEDATLWHFLKSPFAAQKMLVQGLPGLHKGMLMVWYSAFLLAKGVSIADIGLATGIAFCLGGVLSALIVPRLLAASRYGRFGWTLAAGFGLAYSGAIWLAFGGTPTLAQLIVAMCTMELMMAAFNAALYSCAFRWADPAQAATDVSVQDSTFFLGMTIGGVFSGPVAAWLGWPGYFCVVALVAFIAVATYAVLAKRVDAGFQANELSSTR
jgi:PAT family beta-lactamase induction signal transducer AmpG